MRFGGLGTVDVHHATQRDLPQPVGVEVGHPTAFALLPWAWPRKQLRGAVGSGRADAAHRRAEQLTAQLADTKESLAALQAVRETWAKEIDLAREGARVAERRAEQSAQVLAEAQGELKALRAAAASSTGPGGCDESRVGAAPDRTVGPGRDHGLMQYDEIASLRRLNPAWRLLRADNAPLILSFLGRVFVEENVREITAADLVNRLDDELYALNQRLGADAFPKSAKAYLDDWSTTDTQWLRKYYVDGSDEPRYDATQAVERAVSWVGALREREFVGTESRLNTVFELLRQIVYGSDADPQVRLAELKRRRAEIDDQIAATERGDFAVMDSLGRRDRYQQFAETARALLSDFREVEANLRGLDRQMREKIATWQGTKGELLDEFVGTRNGIGDSDQGRSLRAFYDLLLTSDRLTELTELIAGAERLNDADVVDDRLSHIHYDWLTAAKRAQDIVGQLSQQLRRFLDDQVWLENRRVMDLLHGIESSAVALRDDRAEDYSFTIDAAAPAINLPTERPLYRRPATARIDSTGIESGQAEDVGDAIYRQNQVDTASLIANVRSRLRRTGQATLADVLSNQPLHRGLEELVAYLHLGEGDFDTVVDESRTDTVTWTGPDGRRRTARMARVIYVSTGSTTREDPGGFS